MGKGKREGEGREGKERKGWDNDPEEVGYKKCVVNSLQTCQLEPMRARLLYS